MSKRKNLEGSGGGRANKKQKIDDYQSIEITKKTSYKHNEQQPFGPKDITETNNGSFFISNDDSFKKLLEKENKKYVDSMITTKNNKKKNKKKKNKSNDLVNKMNLTLADLLNNNNNEDDDDEEDMSEETDSGGEHSCSHSSSSSSYSSSPNKQIVPILNSNEDSESGGDDNMVYYNKNSNSSFKECFLCSWGNSAHDGIYSKQLEELKNIYIKYRAFSTEEDLANMLYLYFIENIWTPNSNMPLLTPLIALEHIKNIGKTHTLNATEHIIDSIRLWSRVRDNLQYSLYHQDNKADKDQFNCLMNTQKILNSLYTMKPKNMSFIDPDCAINIMKGPLFKIETLNENTERIIKTKKITQTNIKNRKTLDI